MGTHVHLGLDWFGHIQEVGGGQETLSPSLEIRIGSKSNQEIPNRTPKKNPNEWCAGTYLGMEKSLKSSAYRHVPQLTRSGACPPDLGRATWYVPGRREVDRVAQSSPSHAGRHSDS
jgi:hypothetical protein